MSARSIAAGVIGAVLALILIAQLLRPLWRARRRQQLAARPLPASWREVLTRNVALYARMPAPLAARLDGLLQIFIAEKQFIGCGGLTLTEEIRVTIAAQACILIVNRDGGCFDTLHTVLVYPRAFYVEHEQMDEDGVVAEGAQALTGESWSTGQIVVSWDDARAGGRDASDGGNVVLHEFAHQLDGETGVVNGAPALLDDDAYSVWAQTLRTEYAALEAAVARGEDSLIDAYGATHPAEFFAVATEVFFERAGELRSRHPHLYQRMREYYHVDPASWPTT